MRTCLFCFFVMLFHFSLAQSKMPSVAVTTLEGKEVKTDVLTDSTQFTVISFWATWCKPCMQELDALSEMYEDWQAETKSRIIAVAIDDSRTLSGVKTVISSRGWPFMAYLDNNQNLKRALNISNVPYSIVIDKTGKIIWRHSGYTPGSEKQLKKFLKKQLKG